uniref:Uncharacterized protein n=1 Tax=Mesocestoides corti TaxID=53468 RepID=A0A5K3FM24_MESCO
MNGLGNRKKTAYRTYLHSFSTQIFHFITFAFSNLLISVCQFEGVVPTLFKLVPDRNLLLQIYSSIRWISMKPGSLICRSTQWEIRRTSSEKLPDNFVW